MQSLHTSPRACGVYAHSQVQDSTDVNDLQYQQRQQTGQARFRGREYALICFAGMACATSSTASFTFIVLQAYACSRLSLAHTHTSKVRICDDISHAISHRLCLHLCQSMSHLTSAGVSLYTGAFLCTQCPAGSYSSSSGAS
jgi:hypothetical protein